MNIYELFNPSLLFEYSFNTKAYGAWINAKEQKIYPVEEEQHIPWAKEHSGELGVPKITGNNSLTVYPTMFSAGWVRIVHPNWRSDRELMIEGKLEDIKLAWKKCLPLVRTAREVWIDSDESSSRFELPGDYAELIKFVFE